MQNMNFRYDILKHFGFKAAYTLLGFMVCAAVTACGDKEEVVPAPNEQPSSTKITDIYVPQSITVIDNEPFTIRGIGYEMTDVVSFINSDGEEYTAVTLSVTAQDIEVQLPEEMPGGTYVVTVTRANGDIQKMGNTRIVRQITYDVPDREGMNIKGRVVCNGQGLADVVVSDGYNLVSTEPDGAFWMNSDKKEGMVFISVPSGYMPAVQKGIPQFFQRLNFGKDVTEQLIFELNEEPNDDYVVLAMADAHLANRSSKDVSQFQDGFVRDANALIASYEGMGKKVYGITLGDQSWDLYWYDNNFGIKEATAEFARVNCPIFHCVGNHDNDMKVSGDWESAGAWRTNVSPTYYSFNLGKVHYVILDDIEYYNTANNREQTHRVMPEQMEWLRKDLATVKDKSAPLVVCMHVPLHRRENIDANGQQVDDPTLITNASELIEALSGFSDVKLLTGHTHINYDAKTGSIHEYNIGAVCATWWWTGSPGYPGNHVCRDGSPGGYGVFEWDGTDFNHYYKGIGHEANYQMHTYDLNNVLISRDQHCPDGNAQMVALIPTYSMGYDVPNKNNEVLINVFNFGYDWKIEVTENGRKLDVKRVKSYDPLHIVSFEMVRLNKNKHNFADSSMKTCWTTHLFKVKASSATSTLNITVTDEHGTVYTETMTRPKAFTYSMD